MSLLCQILDKVCNIEDQLEGLDAELICEKIDALEETLCAKLEGLEEILCAACPLPLVEPFTGTTAVVEGDQTTDYAVGDTFDLTDENGVTVGTGVIQTMAYNEETNQTTFNLNSVTYSTGQTATAVKGVRREFTSSIAKKEAVKKEEAVEERG